jgi:MFS family permease
LAINLSITSTGKFLAALEPDIRETFAANDVNAMTKTGLLGTRFSSLTWSAPRFSVCSPIDSPGGLLSVCWILWSPASGGSGLAATFAILFATRICVVIGEGGYGPAAPTILSDLFPIETRVASWRFCAAIPAGSALG